MSPRALRIAAFVLLVSGLFVYVGNVVPQIKSSAETGPVQIGTTPEELVEAGRKIAERESSQCLTCHAVEEDPKARCPIWSGLGETASRRRPGLTAAQYLVESAYDPNAFVVAGYPRDQMRPVNRPPIALSHDEIKAVLCFLNSLGGATDEAFLRQLEEAQDPWRRGLLQPDEGGAQEDRIPILPGDADRGGALFQEQGCIDCHRVGTMGKEVCPDLTSIGGQQTPEYILESILDPGAVIVRGYKMLRLAWKASGRPWLSGLVLEWIPDEDHPLRVRFAEVKGGRPEEEREIDVSRLAGIGDVTVVTKTPEGEYVPFVGFILEGDQESGVKLRVLAEGGWSEMDIPSERIEAINPTLSPMPGNYGDLLTARQVYDLVAYLARQKGATR